MSQQSHPPNAADEPTVAYVATQPTETVVCDDLDGETRALLRYRLIVVLAIFTGISTVSIVVALLLSVGNTTDWMDLTLLGTCAGLIVLLTSRRSLSLFALRACELLAFGFMATGGAYWTYQISAAENLRRLATVPRGIIGAAGIVSVIGLALLTIYGLMIPNTWRRAVIVIGGFTLLPFAVMGLQWMREAPDGRIALELVTYVGFWLLLGAAVAIFGSHKISQLRREVAEAHRLGPYLLGPRLGSGGMGVVHLAEHRLLKRPCAVKLIRPDRATDPRELQRFEREVQVTAALTHPNAVQIFDFGHTPDGTFYYAMEYLPGLTLQELVNRHGPVPAGRAVHFLRQVCGALREAHAAGLIHRDVKPGNVIVCERGGVPDVAKLLDFGLVREIGASGAELTREGAVVGTPTYLSPEQADGESSVDARSDVYAVGGLAYFLLTGRPPFVEQNAMRVIAAHLHEAPAPPSRHCPDVPADLEALVLRCLAKSPAERFADVESLERALAECDCASEWTRNTAAEWWRSISESGQCEPIVTT